VPSGDEFELVYYLSEDLTDLKWRKKGRAALNEKTLPISELDAVSLDPHPGKF